MAKTKTPSYVLNLKLKTNKRDIAILNKRMEIGRHLYNSVLNEALKRYRSMLQSKKYTKFKKELKNINAEYHSNKNNKALNKIRKQKYKELTKIYNNFGLNEYSFINLMTPMYKPFNKNIDNKTAQAISSRVWKSFDKLLNGDGKRVYFKRRDDFNSLEGKWNKSGIRYLEDKRTISWNKLNIPVIIKSNDMYAQRAIQDRVKYCRIIRKEIKGKNKYYVQLILEGVPPQKINENTGETKGSVGIGNVGLDIGTQTIAISSKHDVKLLELASSINNIDRKIKLIQRKMDRSRRSMNPNKYNEDGTIKNGNKDKWIYSNKYLKLKSLRKDLFRKQTIWRKQDHEILANYIVSLGDNILVETMNFKGLQKRAKNTTINSKGKFNKKKRFGKSLANKAPSMLLEIIDRKLNYENLLLKKINTYKVKASQYNHFTDEYNKKDLKDRWNNDIEIQRDMYSAFLIMNVNSDLESIDRDKCIETYDNFKELHDREINRLKELKLNGIKLISSMGI